MKISLALAALLVAGLSAGCSQHMAPFGEDMKLAQGPDPQLMRDSDARLACVASRISLAQRRSESFGVLDFPDRTGTENKVGNDSFGTFNTQGAADILASSLMRAKVKLIELGPSFRTLVDWGIARGGQPVTTTLNKAVADKDPSKPATEHVTTTTTSQVGVKLPSLGIYGAITTTDFIPGGGVQAGILGGTASYNQNRAVSSLDMRAVRMPGARGSGGDTVASTTIIKQISQDGTRVNFTRYLGPLDKPVLASFEIGGDRREAMKLATRAMIDLGVADLLSKIYRVNGCMGENIVAALN